MSATDLPCNVRGCLFVSRWVFHDERHPEQMVFLCKTHFEELRRKNPSRAERFIPLARSGTPQAEESRAA